MLCDRAAGITPDQRQFVFVRLPASHSGIGPLIDCARTLPVCTNVCDTPRLIEDKHIDSSERDTAPPGYGVDRPFHRSFVADHGLVAPKLPSLEPIGPMLRRPAGGEWLDGEEAFDLIEPTGVSWTEVQPLACSAAIHSSTTRSSRSRGSGPWSRTAMWKRRMSKRGPSARVAFSRSSMNFSWPIM